MALPDPLIIPACLEVPVRLRFDCQPLGAQSQSAGGAVAFQEIVGGSLWEMSLTSKPLVRSNYDQAHAFILSNRAGANRFKAWDLHRCYPLAYGANLPATRHDTTAFDGTCTVTAAGGNTVSLSGLPTTYAVTVGDYISFPWRGVQQLVKALESATAVAGVISNLTVSPWLLAGGTVPATATLVRAWCLMRLKPGSFSGERTIGDPISFEAIQTLA